MKLVNAIRLTTKTIREIDNNTLNPSDKMLHSILTTIINGLGALKAQNGLSFVEYRAEYISINLDDAEDYWIATEDARLCWCFRVLKRLSEVWNRESEHYNNWLDSFDAPQVEVGQ